MSRAALWTICGFVLLLGLWMLYTSDPKPAQLYVGLGVAILGVIGSAIIRGSGFARFHTRSQWLLLALLEPWYVAVGSVRLAKNLIRALLGKPSLSRFHALPMNLGGDDPLSEARRMLLIAYLTIPPDSIAIGIDRENQELLLHEIEPAPLPLIARKLGVRE